MVLHGTFNGSLRSASLKGSKGSLSESVPITAFFFFGRKDDPMKF